MGLRSIGDSEHIQCITGMENLVGKLSDWKKPGIQYFYSAHHSLTTTEFKKKKRSGGTHIDRFGVQARLAGEPCQPTRNVMELYVGFLQGCS